MEEKIIIKGKPQGIKKVTLIVFVIGVVLFIITAVTGWSWDDIVPVMYVVSIGIIKIGRAHV